MKTHLITLAVPHDEGMDHEDTIQHVARAVPGSHVVQSEIVEADLFAAEWDGGASALPMTAQDALTMMDEAGYISVVVAIDQATFLDAARSANDEFLMEDAVHKLAFDFGFAASAKATIVAVQGDQLLVHYSTLIEEAFAV